MRSGFDDYAGHHDSTLNKDFLFLFPSALAALRPLEARLARFPAGAPYIVLCRKGG